MAEKFNHLCAYFWGSADFGNFVECVVAVMRECSEFVGPELREHWDAQVSRLKSRGQTISHRHVGESGRTFAHLFQDQKGFVTSRLLNRTFIGVELCLMRPDLEQLPMWSRHEGLVERILFDIEHGSDEQLAQHFDVIVSGMGEAPRLVLERAFDTDWQCKILSSAHEPSAECLYGGRAHDLGLLNAPIYRDNQG